MAQPGPLLRSVMSEKRAGTRPEKTRLAVQNPFGFGFLRVMSSGTGDTCSESPSGVTLVASASDPRLRDYAFLLCAWLNQL